jgi:hypothetical protein
VPSTQPPGPPGPEPSVESNDRYGSRLLVWLWERTGGTVGEPVPCSDFGVRQSIPDSAVRTVAARLRGHGLVRLHGEHRDGPLVALEAAGAAQARRMLLRRADPAERGRYAVGAVLKWTYAQDLRRPARIQQFFDSHDLFFFGEALRRDEVAKAVTYLVDAGLMVCDGPPFHGLTGSHVSLTEHGTEAVLTGGEVAAFVDAMRERNRRVEGVVIQGPVHTVTGDVTVHGYSVEQLAELVGQFAAVLGVTPEVRAELLRQADALRAAGGGDDPEPAGQRGRLARIRELLSGAPDTVGRQLVLDAVGQVLGRLLG